MMKKIFFSILILMSISTNHFINASISESLDEIDNIPEIDPILPGATESTGNCIDAETILDLITPACSSEDNPPLVNLIPILKHDLYKKTMGPVLRRSLLDQPSLQPYLFGDRCEWNIGVQPFYNVTPKVYLTNKSDVLSCYIDLSNKNIFKEIDIVLEDLAKINDENSEIENQLNIPDILSLFKPVKLQQHRAGFMFDFSKTTNNWYISWRIPLYYLIEHFHLTDKELNRIKTAPFFTSSETTALDTGSENELETFLKKHLSTDTLGLGDSRFIAQISPYESNCFKAWLGFQMTFPTAKKFKSGLIGEEIDFYAPTPTISLQKLFNLNMCAVSEGEIAEREANREISNILQNLIICSIDRLSTILINTPLGNGKHVGFGPQFDFVYDFNNCWSTHGTYIAEWFTNKEERRFFLRQPTKKELCQCFRGSDNPDEKLQLISDLAIDTLFPTPICVTVNPGYLLKFRQLFRYDTEHFNSSLGIDYWRQGKEHFYNFTPTNNNRYSVKKALHSSATQVKLYGSIGYHEENYISDFSSFYLFTWDATIYNKGIGHNYSVGVQCGFDF